MGCCQIYLNPRVLKWIGVKFSLSFTLIHLNTCGLMRIWLHPNKALVRKPCPFCFFFTLPRSHTQTVKKKKNPGNCGPLLGYVELLKLQCSGEELRYLVFHACSADWGHRSVVTNNTWQGRSGRETREIRSGSSVTWRDPGGGHITSWSWRGLGRAQCSVQDSQQPNREFGGEPGPSLSMCYF